MKKTLVLYRLLIALFLIVFIASCKKNNFSASNISSDPMVVPKNIASIIAETFNPDTYLGVNNSNNHSPVKTVLNGNNKIEDILTISDHTGLPAFYIINFQKNSGFIIVSADYRIAPVLAFVETGNFKGDDVINIAKGGSLPFGFSRWVNRTVENVEAVRRGLYSQTQYAKADWKTFLDRNLVTGAVQNAQSRNTYDDAISQEILSDSSSEPISGTKVPPPPPNPCTNNPNYTNWGPTTAVGPLLAVTWGQENSYNNLCPNLGCTDPWGPYALTGCVATSMAQILQYEKPSSSHNYVYSSMPTTSGNSEVQRMMKDLGTSVSMQYGCEESGSYTSLVPAAYKSSFGITSANYASYSSGNIYQVLNDINSNWPVILSGFDNTAGGHQWVCDGYSEATYYYCQNGQEQTMNGITIHMNWGWHELFCNAPTNDTDYNGWFTYNNWTIPGLNWNFQYSDASVTEIHP